MRKNGVQKERKLQKSHRAPITAKSTAIHSISNVSSGLSGDQKRRQRTYLLSMTVRTICFITAIIVHNPYRPFAIAGALLLPYVAVVAANAGIAGPKLSNAALHAKRRELRGE